MLNHKTTNALSYRERRNPRVETSMYKHHGRSVSTYSIDEDLRVRYKYKENFMKFTTIHFGILWNKILEKNSILPMTDLRSRLKYRREKSELLPTTSTVALGRSTV